jgi:hypothetical protein
MTYLDLLPKDILNIVNEYRTEHEKEKAFIKYFIITTETDLAFYMKHLHCVPEDINDIFIKHKSNMRVQNYNGNYIVERGNYNILLIKDLLEYLTTCYGGNTIRTIIEKFSLPLYLEKEKIKIKNKNDIVP